MTAKAESQPIAERELTLTRLFAAPRALVFRAWTEPQRLARWWGPKGFTNPVCELDLRVGGAIRIVMRAPDGTDHPMAGVFREIDAPERLVFTNNAVDAAGKTLLEGLTTVTLAEHEGRTRLVVKTRAIAVVAAAARFLDGMEEGWTQSLERLGEAVAASAAGRSAAHGSFAIERRFAAPPARVFDAWASVEAKARWFVGPGGWQPLERALDFRVGGRERVRGRHASDMVSNFDAIYLDIVPSRRIVYAYDMYVDERKISVSLATVELAAEGAGTRMIFTEQAAFLDGYDDAGGRERGSQMLIDQLEASLS
jgi:uncharacterized protein YndB with AHSA1/START domain